MKKTLLFSLLLVATAFSAHAQEEGTVTLNVKLHPIQTIMVNPSQNEVDLDYTTNEDYARGVSVKQRDHLSIYSTGAFNVNVRSSSSLLTGTASNIDASDIKITAALGATKKLVGSTVNSVNLTAGDQLLISNTLGGIDRNFNITYAAAGAGKYINKYYSSESPTVYTTTVTYTIEAQ
ncbi:hypothetical protein [Flavobacterium sp. JP2137]|uniref:hypothetical protein n=1 Tax=Flavobacterium sp. JP2137 TaxID=3414510 RepID=UPI003D2FE6D9